MTMVNEYWYGRGRINNQILKILIIRFHPYNLQLPLYTVALFALLQLHHITPPPPRPPLHWQLPQSTYTLQSHFFRGAFATLPLPHCVLCIEAHCLRKQQFIFFSFLSACLNYSGFFNVTLCLLIKKDFSKVHYCFYTKINYLICYLCWSPLQQLYHVRAKG